MDEARRQVFDLSRFLPPLTSTENWVKVATLEEKQKYYEYGANWSYKEPPVLDKRLVEDLHRISPAFHFLWGGVALIRKSPLDPYPQIRGDLSATKTIYYRDDEGRPRNQLIPRFAAGARVHPQFWCYRDDDNHVIRVTRPDFIPEGKHRWLEADYVQYGKLRWYIVRHLTPEQLVEAGIYHARDPHIPSGGDYFFQLLVETPDKKYFEPNREYLDAISEHLREEQTESLHDLYARDHEKRVKQDERDEAISDRELMALTEQLLIGLGIDPSTPLFQ